MPGVGPNAVMFGVGVGALSAGLFGWVPPRLLKPVFQPKV